MLALGLSLALGLLAPLSAAPTAAEKAATRATIEKFLKCWETGDQATFASLLHPDLVFGYPGGRFNYDGLVKTFAAYHQQKHDIKIYFGDKFISDGRKSVLTYQFAATDNASGKRFAVGTAVICGFKDGKIVAFREYWDSSVPEDQKAGELPLDEGSVSPWPISVWLRADTIN
jgi:ketosteroid isomerase-like protein